MSINRACAVREIRMFSWLSSGLVRNVALGLVGIVAYVVLWAAAYNSGYQKASLRADAKFNAYRLEIAQAQAQAARVFAEQVQAEAQRADAAAEKLLAQQADIAKLSQELQKRVRHVSTVYVERAGEAVRPLPSNPFTRGWVHDYNAALGVRLPGADHVASELTPKTGSLDPARTAPRFADLARSTVTQGDVLATHHENARICRDAVAQLNAILDLHEGARP